MEKNVKLGLIGRKRKNNNIQNNNKNKNIEKEEEESVKEEEIEKILCEICKKNQYKYNCPRCKIKTCSVECEKLIKINMDVMGKKINLD